VLNNSTGPITSAFGVYGIAQKASTGTIGTAYGGYFYVANTNATNAITTAYGVYIEDSAETGTITSDYGLYQADTDAMNYFGGKLGIGVNNNTTYGLSVVGSGTTGAINAQNGYYTNGTAGVNIGACTASQAIVSEKVNLGIVTAGNCGTPSDQRLKTNIQPLSNALDKIMQLKPVQYNWINPDLHLRTTRTISGFLAQDVAGVFPDWVVHSPARGADIGLVDPDGTSLAIPTVDNEWPAILTLGIQELYNKVENLPNGANEDLSNYSLRISDTGAGVYVNQTNTELQRFGVFSEVKIADIQAGTITADTINTQELVYKGQDLENYIDDKINQAEFVSPLSSGDIAFNLSSGLDASLPGKFTITNVSAEVASIDASGNATFSGTLVASEIITPDGELFARISKNEADIAQALDTLLAVETNISMQYDAFDASASGMIASLLTSGFDPSAERITLTKPVTLNDNLQVYGSTSLGDTSVAGSLSVSGLISFTSWGIESLSSTLSIEPRGIASVEIGNKLLIISPDGQVAINGDLTVAGTIATDRIAPLSNSLDIDLSGIASDSAENGVFTIRSGFGNEALRVLPKGDVVIGSSLTASGSATVDKLNFATRGQDRSATGKGTIVSGSTSVIIPNRLLTADSLVYVTPISSTSNKVLYVSDVTFDQSCSEITCDSSFTVAIDAPAIGTNIPFNWWIVN
jgi:hypothetical protein